MRTCASTACNNAAARPRWPHMAYSLLKVTPCIQPWPTPFLVPDYSEGSVVSWNTTEVSCNFFWRDSWDWNPIWFSFRGQNHDTGITEPCAAALVGWAGIRRFSRIRQVQCFRKGTVVCVHLLPCLTCETLGGCAPLLMCLLRKIKTPRYFVAFILEQLHESRGVFRTPIVFGGFSHG